jgi:glycosyltransferase involved in cell wall biosynthesis
MPGCYELADIVVMASEYEGMSRAYIETMAARRPLIAADSLAAKELVADETNGMLYPVGDVEALAERIVRLAQDPTLRARLGAAGEETAQARSVSESVPAYLAEFESLLGSC